MYNDVIGSKKLSAAMATPKLTGYRICDKRDEIRQYFQESWTCYERLFDCLVDTRAWYTKANALRHPLIFYFGHTAVFFINKLFAAGFIRDRVDPRIESMMAIGVDEMSWDDLDERHYDFPKIEIVRAYRNDVRAVVLRFIDAMPIDLPISWSDPAWVILMGVEHERIHLETSSVLIRQLPLPWVGCGSQWPRCQLMRDTRHAVPENRFVAVSSSDITLGKTDATYGWDTEYGSERCHVAQFDASEMLVSNAEYLTFIEDGGYQDARWWDVEGLTWRTYAKALMPSFWRGEITQPDGLSLRVMTEEIPMSWDWPVEVNHLEASAFCRWKSAQTQRRVQLPTEGEWYLLRRLIPGDAPGWVEMPGNINLAWWASSCPVDTFKQDKFYDLVGNVWQWTSTVVSAYDGFKVHPLYDDFSVPTFDGKHMLMKGGSWISTGNETLMSARYAFRRHFFQHAGFRYVVSTQNPNMNTNPYETDAIVCQYLEFQYGASYFDVENYAEKLVEIGLEHAEGHALAMDIGCATGRASFALARHFDHVTGIDYSARFIDLAQKLACGETISYSLPSEGELSDHRQICLSDSGITASTASKVRFAQGDACNLKETGELYDLVIAGNLIDRLVEPSRFLVDISRMIRTGGVLLLASPFTWLECFTPKSAWIGGVRENGESVSSYTAIQRLLDAEFEEVTSARDVPFVVRETARKFQHSVAHVTLWRKR